MAWSYNDMPGISLNIISHWLSINPVVQPVRQKRRAYDPERYEGMKKEVDRLSSIGFINKVDYPTWLANVVMVSHPQFNDKVEAVNKIIKKTLKTKLDKAKWC
ncbi:hypothetical protein L3X38_032025 [Prunus dulcis]|uniref:Uncharacterized protein n=1 Tax=Prunus dulcis TaxID=3755 RepID=A0AAD4VDM3_PRUDU|nr:hypothetical protein L3X38_032025 [Prunus dulcis]